MFVQSSASHLGNLLLEVAEHVLRAGDNHVDVVDCGECGKTKSASVLTTDTGAEYARRMNINGIMKGRGDWVRILRHEDWEKFHKTHIPPSYRPGFHST